MIAFPSPCLLQVFQPPLSLQGRLAAHLHLAPWQGMKVPALLVWQLLLIIHFPEANGVAFLGEIIHTTAVQTEASDIWKGEILERIIHEFAHQILVWKSDWICIWRLTWTLQKLSQTLSSTRISLITSYPCPEVCVLWSGAGCGACCKISDKKARCWKQAERMSILCSNNGLSCPISSLLAVHQMSERGDFGYYLCQPISDQQVTSSSRRGLTTSCCQLHRVPLFWGREDGCLWWPRTL